MKGLKTVAIAHKKLATELVKKRKAGASANKDKPSNKKTNNSGAPKRPLTAFLLFMENFRKSYKENFSDNKSVSVVGKAGGEKWKAMSESEKAPYVAKAVKRKAEYEKAKEEFDRKLVMNASEAEKPEESEKSSSKVHDGAEQEASSSS